MFRKIKDFVKGVAKAAYHKVKNFFVGVWRHAEAVAILTLAAFGLNVLLGEIPFVFALPMWIEAPLVIPVLAVTIISLIVKFAEWRARRRIAKATLAAI